MHRRFLGMRHLDVQMSTVTFEAFNNALAGMCRRKSVRLFIYLVIYIKSLLSVSR